MAMRTATDKTGTGRLMGQETGMTETSEAKQAPPDTHPDDEHPAPAADPIAQALRDLYRSTEAEPLPEQLRALLARLAEEDGA